MFFYTYYFGLFSLDFILIFIVNYGCYETVKSEKNLNLTLKVLILLINM